MSPPLHATAGTRITKGPYVTAVSDTGADVRFELDPAGPATIEVVREGESGATLAFASADVSAMHVVHAIGLAPGARYDYLVRGGGVSLSRARFATMPARSSGAPLTFLVYGDVRSDEAVHAAIVRAMSAVPCDFLVNTGDAVADGGSQDDWQTFFDIERPLLLERPVFMSIGNHELYDDRSGANFARYFGFFGPSPVAPSASERRSYGSVRVSNVRMFFLNAMHDWTGGEERDWLERELVLANDEPGLLWRIAVVHQGPWSAGPHGPNAMLVDAHIPELLAAHKVDLLLSGHDHIYERGAGYGGTKYLISGGGGAPLYRIAETVRTTRKAEAAYHFVEVTTSGDALRIVARRLDGTLIDRCGFRRGSDWDCDRQEITGPAPEPSPVVAAPPPTAVSPSRCSCDLPGARANSAGFAVLVLGSAVGSMLAGARVRSSRRRG